MIRANKVLSLLDFAQTDLVSDYTQLFLDEIAWIISKAGTRPPRALFIPYAYQGNNYPAFFQMVSGIFARAGIPMDDINSGDPSLLIARAPMIVVAGGSVKALTNSLTQLITSAFDPYTAIKDRVNNGIPYLGWNQGSMMVSPEHFDPADGLLYKAFNISPFQIICNFVETDAYRQRLKDYLLGHLTISKAIVQVDRPDGSSVRLEDSGSGLLDSPGGISPLIISYAIINGDLRVI